MPWTPKVIHAPFLLNPNVRELIGVFRDSGNQNAIRFVGGCVRSVLMNMPANDIDIATTLTPDEVGAIFRKAGHNVHPTGIEHGTVSVVVDKEVFEITTCRRDVETDGRRAVIEYTTDWAEDAERRDFRCNALYMDAHGHLYDYVGGGIQDAMERRLVFVGDAKTRIREDYLRILRLFRFMATLNATASIRELAACRFLREGLNQISGERIEKEMMKLLGAVNPLPAIQAMDDCDVLPMAFGAVQSNEDMLRQLFGATTDPVLRLAGVLYRNPEQADPLFARWKSSTAIQQRVRTAIAERCEYRPWFSAQVTQEAYRVGVQIARDRMTLSWAVDVCNDVPFEDVMALADEIEANLPVFPLRGADVLDLGVKPGRVVGTLLKEIESWWVGSGYPDEVQTRAELAVRIAALA